MHHIINYATVNSFWGKVCATAGSVATLSITDSFLARIGEFFGVLKGGLKTKLCRRDGALDGDVGEDYELFEVAPLFVCH